MGSRDARPVAKTLRANYTPHTLHSGPSTLCGVKVAGSIAAVACPIVVCLWDEGTR